MLACIEPHLSPDLLCSLLVSLPRRGGLKPLKGVQLIEGTSLVEPYTTGLLQLQGVTALFHNTTREDQHILSTTLYKRRS